MASKLLCFLVLIAVATQGYANLTTVTLADVEITFVSHELAPKAISIPKWWFDTLLSCHITFPNGVTYEAYPNNNIPFPEVTYLQAVEPFNSCAVAFTKVDAGWSGAYELLSLVSHQDNSMTLTNQRHHLNVIESEVGMPSK